MSVIVAATDPKQARLLRDTLAPADDMTVVGYALGIHGLEDLLLLTEPEVVVMDRELFDWQRQGRSGEGHEAPPQGAKNPAYVVVSDPFDRADGVALVRDGAHVALHLRSHATAVRSAVRVAAAGGVSVGESENSAVMTSVDLTARESDVLEGVLLGWSNIEIAGEIAVSPETVKTHVSSLMRKFACRNRVTLAIRAYQSGARP